MLVHVNVSYDGNQNINELMNKSKPGSNGSNKKLSWYSCWFIYFIYFIYLFIYLLNIYTGRIFLTSSFSHLLMTQKPDVRVKIIPLAFSLFTGSSVKHLQRPIPYHEINVFSRPHFFTIELYTSHLHLQFVFLFHNLCTVILTRIIDYYC